MLKGEGEPSISPLLEAAHHDRKSLHHIPGVHTLNGEGPRPLFVRSLDDLMPARDLLRNRRRYFIGVLDPCASIEFSRGCPWDCVFCSAWTFYGRSNRTKSPEVAVEEIAGIREPGIFLLDDVAFIQADHGMRIGELIAKKEIRKKYYLETRGDILLRNKEVFKFWRKLGLEYMFLGIEAIDEEGLKRFRKRVSLSQNFEALEFARFPRRFGCNQYHSRSFMEPRSIQSNPRMVHGDSRNREHQRKLAVPGHGKLADRIQKTDNTRLSVVRYSACGTAYRINVRRILS